MRAIILSTAILLLAAQAAEARAPALIECSREGCFSRALQQHRNYRQPRQQARKQHRHARQQHAAVRRAAHSVKPDRGERAAQILPHPAGCPSRAFCGCGVAVKVFGRPLRELWLAANWFKYPAAAAAPGRVAVRRGHVFYIVSVLNNNRVLAWDPNSGGHKTRLHVRSLAGYRVVNPRA